MSLCYICGARRPGCCIGKDLSTGCALELTGVWLYSVWSLSVLSAFALPIAVLRRTGLEVGPQLRGCTGRTSAGSCCFPQDYCKSEE